MDCSGTSVVYVNFFGLIFSLKSRAAYNLDQSGFLKRFYNWLEVFIFSFFMMSRSSMRIQLFTIAFLFLTFLYQWVCTFVLFWHFLSMRQVVSMSRFSWTWIKVIILQVMVWRMLTYCLAIFLNIFFGFYCAYNTSSF